MLYSDDITDTSEIDIRSRVIGWMTSPTPPPTPVKLVQFLIKSLTFEDTAFKLRDVIIFAVVTGSTQTTPTQYRIVGNFGEVFNLAIW